LPEAGPNSIVAQDDPVSGTEANGKVFVVHGHGGVEHAVAGLLRKLGLEPVILHEQANAGLEFL
jgi:hypothetical protein